MVHCLRGVPEIRSRRFKGPRRFKSTSEGTHLEIVPFSEGQTEAAEVWFWEDAKSSDA